MSFAQLSERFNQLITLPALVGHFAHWAVRLSPYVVPAKLPDAIEKFHTEMDQRLALDDYHGLKLRHVQSLNGLRTTIEEALKAIPEVVAWNSPKIENGGQFNFISRHDGPRDPDRDFVDLDALARNIAMETWAEAVRDQVFDENFERTWTREPFRPAPSVGGPFEETTVVCEEGTATTNCAHVVGKIAPSGVDAANED